jgi:hypothetical protein
MKLFDHFFEKKNNGIITAISMKETEAQSKGGGEKSLCPSAKKGGQSI